MTLSRAYAWLIGALALAGCSDFSQHHFGGVRQTRDDVAEGPPKPAPALAIPNPPTVARVTPDDKVKQVALLQEREPIVEPNPKALENPLRMLYERAAKRSALMESYIFRLKRRESVAGKKQPEEIVCVRLRREPFSVHLKWLGTEGKGREAIYVKGKFKDEMQLLLAPNDIFPFSPVMRYSISPNDPLAKAKGRYPITQTGFASSIERFGKLIAAVEKGDTSGGTVKYLGQVKRPEFEAKLEAVHQALPPKSDPLLPRGGQRWWFFDATSGLPVLIITHDPDGEVEYYCHDNIIWPAPMDDDDFNPDRVWRK